MYVTMNDRTNDPAGPALVPTPEGGSGLWCRPHRARSSDKGKRGSA